MVYSHKSSEDVCIKMMLSYIIVGLAFLWRDVVCVLDVPGYNTYEYKVCSGVASAQYIYTGSVALTPFLCKDECLKTDGCTAFTVDYVNKICLFYESCEERDNNGLYTAYVAVFCGGPPGLANGRPTASSFYYNSAAAYQCIDDYNLIGKDTVRCDENGTWSGEEPTCEYTKYHECQKFCEFTSDSFWTIRCPPSYQLDVIYANYGLLNERCNSGVRMPECRNYESNDKIKDLCNGRQSCLIDTTDVPTGLCDNATAELHVEWKCVNNRQKVDWCYADCFADSIDNGDFSYYYNYYGATIRYDCDPGYEIAENVSYGYYYCADGEVAGSPPTCSRVHCPDIDTEGALLDTEDTTYETVVSVQCRDGYTLVGDTTLTCQSDKTWSGQFLCDPVDCMEFNVANAKAIDFSSGTTNGLTAQIACLSGYHISGIEDPGTVTTCQSDGNWSITPTCVKKDCGQPPEVDENGNIDFNINSVSTTFGEALTYNCNEGFLPASVNITCDPSGTWSAMHVCTGVQCPDPETELSVSSVVLSNGQNYQSVATVTCVDGYEFLPTSTAVCGQTEQWNPPISCQRKHCGSPSNISHAVLEVSGTKYEDSASYECDTGYELAENITSVTVTCGSNGKWSDVPTCSVVDCANPLEITRGAGSASFETTTYGSSVTYECDSGYLMLGNASATCLESKTWSSDPPICELMTCPAISAGPGQGATDNATIGNIISYVCDEGHSLIGSENITCLPNGTWDYGIPTCEPVDCGEVSATIENGEVTVGGTAYTQQVKYTCNEGYRLIGSEVITCTKDATWNDNPPTCKDIIRLRMLTYVKVSLECDNYNVNELHDLFTKAQRDLPSQVMEVLQSVHTDFRLSLDININGIRCNSPLGFVLEVIVESIGDEATTQISITNALQNLTTKTGQLTISGEETTVTFTGVQISGHTEISCGRGHFADVSSMECVPCAEDTYQPEDIPELCRPCPGNTETDAVASYGDERVVCKPLKDRSKLTLGLATGLPLAVILLLAVAILLYVLSKQRKNPDVIKPDFYDPRKPGYRHQFNNIYSVKLRNQNPHRWQV